MERFGHKTFHGGDLAVAGVEFQDAKNRPRDAFRPDRNVAFECLLDMVEKVFLVALLVWLALYQAVQCRAAG